MNQIPKCTMAAGFGPAAIVIAALISATLVLGGSVACGPPISTLPNCPPAMPSSDGASWLDADASPSDIANAIAPPAVGTAHYHHLLFANILADYAATLAESDTESVLSVSEGFFSHLHIGELSLPQTVAEVESHWTRDEHQAFLASDAGVKLAWAHRALDLSLRELDGRAPTHATLIRRDLLGWLRP